MLPSLESNGSPPLLSSPQTRVTPPGSSTIATSSENHRANDQRKPFRPNNTIPSSSSNTSRDQNHNQRGVSYGSGSGTNRNHNNNSYPGGYINGRDMNLQGMMRPQMLMGPPYMLYTPHIIMPYAPPVFMAFGGPFQPLLMYKILTQVEYYFSADNLSKDEYLRYHMDDEGWVPIRLIAGFRKLAELTNNIQTIVEALRSSQVVEIKGETIRRRGDWKKYLLPREYLKSVKQQQLAKDKASLQSQLESMTLSHSSSGKGDGV